MEFASIPVGWEMSNHQYDIPKIDNGQLKNGGGVRKTSISSKAYYTVEVDGLFIPEQH